MVDKGFYKKKTVHLTNLYKLKEQKRISRQMWSIKPDEINDMEVLQRAYDITTRQRRLLFNERRFGLLWGW